MKADWLIYSMLTLLSWGVWGLLLKYASRGLSWSQLYFYSGLATLAIMLVLLLIYRLEMLSVDAGYAFLALIAGVFGGLGYIAMARALEGGGKASIVVPLTSLYPAVTVVLAWLILGEKPGPTKIAGILLALIAIYLLSR